MLKYDGLQLKCPHAPRPRSRPHFRVGRGTPMDPSGKDKMRRVRTFLSIVQNHPHACMIDGAVGVMARAWG